MVSSNDETILSFLKPFTRVGPVDGETVIPLGASETGHQSGELIDDRYIVVREIGRGGMGIVYEAEDLLLGGFVSIKRLLPEHAKRSDVAELFKREGANAIRFTGNSPRFVTMRHVGSDVNGLYLVMDYVTDPTIRSYVNANASGKLPICDVFEVMSDLAHALADLHNLGYVHRDLKPENIFVKSDQGSISVRLVDFGLTKEDIDSTRTNLRGAGTNGYASPEQRKGLPTTAATDIYAFGVISYELLTGELPTAADRLSDFEVNVPAALEDLVMDCLTAKLDRRPPDGNVLVSRLSSIAFDPDTAKAPISSNVDVATIIVDNVQKNALVVINGEVVGSPYVSKIPVSAENVYASVNVSWQGVEVLDSVVRLVADGTHALWCNSAYRLFMSVPNWCEAVGPNGNRITFPYASVLPDGKVLEITFRYGGKSFLTETYHLRPGDNYFDFHYGLSRLVLLSVPIGGTVLIDGVQSSSETVVPVNTTQPSAVLVQVMSAEGNAVWGKTVYLEAGKSHEHAVTPAAVRTKASTDLPPVVVRKPPVLNQPSAQTHRVTFNVLPITSMFQKGGLVHLSLNKNRIASGNAADGVRVTQELSSGRYELIVERQYRAGETYGKGITTKYVIQVGSGHPSFHTVEWSSLAQNYIVVTKS